MFYQTNPDQSKALELILVPGVDSIDQNYMILAEPHTMDRSEPETTENRTKGQVPYTCHVPRCSTLDQIKQNLETMRWVFQETHRAPKQEAGNGGDELTCFPILMTT